MDQRDIDASFKKLFRRTALLLMSRDENGYYLSFIDDTTGRRRSVLHSTIQAALDAAINKHPTMRECSDCKREKPLDQFGQQEGARDGHMSRCKSCEVKRVMAWKRKRRRQRRAIGSKASAN